jgi:hypothetical protein
MQPADHQTHPVEPGYGHDAVSPLVKSAVGVIASEACILNRLRFQKNLCNRKGLYQFFEK